MPSYAGPLSYYVNSPGTGYLARVGNFPTISAAIAAAVADGASAFNPKSIVVEGGLYTEDITIPDGIFVVGVGGPYSAILLNCTITFTGSTLSTGGPVCGISGLTMFWNIDGPAALVCAASSLVDIRDCYIDATQITPTVILINPGASLTLSDTIIRGSLSAASPAIDCDGGLLFARRSEIKGNAGSSVVFRGTAPGNQSWLQWCFLESASGPTDATIVHNAAMYEVLVINSYINQSGDAHGIDIQVAGAGVQISHCQLWVANSGGTNNCVNGLGGGVVNLSWGALTFGPAALGYTNRMATTTIGATALHMTPDSITAV